VEIICCVVDGTPLPINLSLINPQNVSEILQPILKVQVTISGWAQENSERRGFRPSAYRTQDRV